MSFGNKTNTEHAGAKNGGGYWGKRQEAKRYSKKIRRNKDKIEITKELVERKLSDFSKNKQNNPE